MTITGLAEFLEMMKDGGALDDFDLLSVERLGVNNDGEECYGVTIGYGMLQLAVTSWIPAIGIRRIILDIAQEINKRSEAH